MLGNMRSIIRFIKQHDECMIYKPYVKLVNGDILFEGFSLAVKSRQVSGGRMRDELGSSPVLQPLEEYTLHYGVMENPPEDVQLMAAFNYNELLDGLNFDELKPSKSDISDYTGHVDIPCCIMAAVGFMSSLEEETIDEIATCPGIPVCTICLCIQFKYNSAITYIMNLRSVCFYVLYMTHCFFTQNETRCWLLACQDSSQTNVKGNSPTYQQGNRSVLSAVSQLCTMSLDQWNARHQEDICIEQSDFRDLVMDLCDNDASFASRAQVNDMNELKS